jgi:hypothetical protein
MSFAAQIFAKLTKTEWQCVCGNILNKGLPKLVKENVIGG